jgi:septal ring factor EnvC (AmiA/AmiB activator)
MNFDIKNIIIIVLLGFLFVFGYMWYSGRGEYKDRVNQLNKEIKDIQNIKDSIDVENKKLDNLLSNLQMEDSILQVKISEIEITNQKLTDDLIKSKKELLGFRTNIADVKRQIENIRKNPANRDEVELINSLKNKLNKL